MKMAVLATVALTVLAGFASASLAGDGHTMIAPSDIKWGPASKALPAGAQAAVLYGDPSKEGLFVMRLKFPAGYAIAPHMHPVNEVVTVISGTSKMGMGEVADRSATMALPAGGFFALPVGTAHFVYYDEESVIQISTNGPWGIKYVNAKDDPRTTTQ